MAENDLAAGYDDGTFGPTRPVSRQATAAFLHGMAGEPSVGASSFIDVGPGDQFAAAIAWLEEPDPPFLRSRETGGWRPASPARSGASGRTLARGTR